MLLLDDSPAVWSGGLHFATCQRSLVVLFTSMLLTLLVPRCDYGDSKESRFAS